MAEKSFADALNEQIANEFAASQQYIGAAVYYDSETLPRLAAFFYRQAVEERNHAMIMVQYLLDTDEEVQIPDIKSQQTSYDDVVGPVKMALEQEKRVSEEINALFKLARERGDYRAEQFLTWFVKEQVEEVASMTDLLNVVERAKENPLLAEDFLAREQIGDEGADPRAPRRRRSPLVADGPGRRAAGRRRDARVASVWRSSRMSARMSLIGGRLSSSRREWSSTSARAGVLGRHLPDAGPLPRADRLGELGVLEEHPGLVLEAQARRPVRPRRSRAGSGVGATGSVR